MFDNNACEKNSLLLEYDAITEQAPLWMRNFDIAFGNYSHGISQTEEE